MKAADDWMRQFQLKQAPTDLQRTRVHISDVVAQKLSEISKTTRDGVVIKLDKLLAKTGFGSVTECMRKIKERAVEVNGAVQDNPFYSVQSQLPVVLVLKLGRKMREAEIYS